MNEFFGGTLFPIFSPKFSIKDPNILSYNEHKEKSRKEES